MTEAAETTRTDELHARARSTAAVFRTVLGESSLPMAATEGDTHRVQYANAAFCRLVERSDNAVLGQQLSAILGETGLSETGALLDQVYRTGGAASLAVFRERDVQAAIHATFAAWRVPAEHDFPAGLLVQVIDIADQAQAAAELREVNRRLLQAGLDAEVRTETAVALNAALQQSEERLHRALEEQARLLASAQDARGQAEAALRVRDEFLGMAAHELRSPLTAILGTAQLAMRALDRGALDPVAARRHLGTIGASSARLGALLTDLMDVSRMRAGHLAANLQPMDLLALAGMVARRYQEPGTHPQVVCDLPARPVLIQGDSGRLEQVLDNLLSNAVKYSPEGGAVVLRLRQTVEGVALTVQDSGIGLPAGEAERIFEPFRRAPNAAAQGLPGIGLGLHISRQIAEVHGGTLRAESGGEGAGTTMTLWLPAPQV